MHPRPAPPGGLLRRPGPRRRRPRAGHQARPVGRREVQLAGRPTRHASGPRSSIVPTRRGPSGLARTSRQRAKRSGSRCFIGAAGPGSAPATARTADPRSSRAPPATPPRTAPRNGSKRDGSRLSAFQQTSGAAHQPGAPAPAPERLGRPAEGRVQHPPIQRGGSPRVRRHGSRGAGAARLCRSGARTGSQTGRSVRLRTRTHAYMDDESRSKRKRRTAR